ncbi:hypothetical protein J1N09_11645 [Aureitalea sp. L0-47]|uniref:hypothetical protein n=1 Tax=Aureitalea sp. L0-47 TaxID=2816962 RepID=UPI0022370B29|nr:hypothetical protein [Aureitalea sp. L0-47]MCW5520498.1 hypothetical protein [Aureitalea sp. L0-47]
MKRLILVLALLFIFQLNAQRDEAFVDQQLSEFTNKLEERSISSWFSVKRYCTGSIEMFLMEDGSWCSSKGTYYETYVVWTENDGASMIKKVDNCGLFFSIPLKSDELTKFFNENLNELTTTTVKNYRADNITGNPELSTSIHSCKRSYTFRNSSGVSETNYDLFDLSTSEKHPNIHYKHNNALKIVELDKMIDEVIENLQSKFRRQKQ